MPGPFDLIGRCSYDDPQARTNGEFDVVTYDPAGRVFCECKFRGSLMTRRMIDREIEQVRCTGMECHGYGFFSRPGFDCEPQDGEVFYSLDGIYGNS